jgi:hypothetical protein
MLLCFCSNVLFYLHYDHHTLQSNLLFFFLRLVKEERTKSDEGETRDSIHKKYSMLIVEAVAESRSLLYMLIDDCWSLSIDSW